VTVRIPLFSLVLAPCIWVALELLRTYFPLGGFPWNLLGLSQHRILALIQIAELTGVYGISFAIVLVNAALARAISARSRKGPAWREIVLSLAVVLLLGMFGYLRIYQVDRAFRDQPSLKVGIIQGNIDQLVKWNEAVFWRNQNKYIRLSKEILSEKSEGSAGTDLLIWPEAAITAYLKEEWERRHTRLIRSISGFDAYFLVGSVTRLRDKDRQYVYNSAYLFAPFARELLGRYDKIHLVPFGEYVPMKRLLFFADAIAGGATGDTDPGDEIYVFDTGNFRFGCVICFEVIFPDLVRRFKKAGAEFMTTITNDAWFGKTSAPYQHHANVILRCVENRIYFARSAQTGISSIVDPAGRVVTKSRIFEPAALRGEVRLSPYNTIYTRFGDWFAYLVSIIAALGILISALRGWREKS
jgi:apolipoprotein N-acyltransferase